MQNNRKIGAEKERVAKEYLEKEGFLIEEMNFRCSFGEIDIIAREKNYLVFLEVKFRSSYRARTPAEAVDWKKQKKIYKVAEYYLYHYHIPRNQPCRFDVIEIEKDVITLIRNAFGGL